MTESTNYAKLKKEDLVNKFVVIQAPGTYEVTVRNTSVSMPSLSQINENGEAKIITFNSVLKQEIPGLTEKMIAGGEDGVNYEDAGEHFSTFNLEDNDPQFGNAPVKGEKVEVIVEKALVENKSGNARHAGKEILVIRNIKIKQAKAPTTFNWNFTPEVLETEVEETEVEVA